MFYQPLDPDPANKDQQAPEKEEDVELRSKPHHSRTFYRNVTVIEKEDEGCRPKSWARPNDSLCKIEEKEETENQDPRGEYKLCGYLYKHPSSGKRNPVPGLRSLGSSAKKRWFVYSDRVCKLYYYKQRNDTEPLGAIDVALSTFHFDPENKNEGLFTIR